MGCQMYLFMISMLQFFNPREEYNFFAQMMYHTSTPNVMRPPSR